MEEIKRNKMVQLHTILIKKLSGISVKYQGGLFWRKLMFHYFYLGKYNFNLNTFWTHLIYNALD